MQKICVIGGSRYFGKLLIERLQAAGHQVTVINRGSVPPPDGVEHLVADRNDEAALGAVLDARAFDVVVDQVCYTPVQAAIAVRAFAGRTRRYVMTSTIEVYDPATAALPAVPAGTPVPEESVDPATWQVAMDLPWHDDAYLEAHYAEGKRQAEAVFAHAGSFAFTTVRSAHVLGGGAQEFTGRLAHYAGRITQGEEITVHEKALPTVFIHYEELADLLAWATAADFTGPINACSDGPIDVHGLAEIVSTQAGRGVVVYRSVAADEEASPFSFDRHYTMSNARAKALGFPVSHTRDWLPGAVAEALAAISAAPTD